MAPGIARDAEDGSEQMRVDDGDKAARGARAAGQALSSVPSAYGLIRSTPTATLGATTVISILQMLKLSF